MQFQSNLVPSPSQFDPNRNAQQAEAGGFQITQHVPGGNAAQAQPTTLNHHSMQTQTQAQAPLVTSPQPPLFGSAADVFNRSRVISFTEPARAQLNFEAENTDFKNTLVMYKLAADGTIKETNIVYPNASMIGDGGKLKPGISQVELDFNAGDQVGFAMVPNAFRNPLSRDLLARQDGQFALVNEYGHPSNLFTEHPGGMNLVHIDKWGKMQPINGEYGNKLFHTTGNVAQGIQTNVDGHDHADQIVDPDTGRMLIGMDDRYAPENPGRESLIFKLHIGENNARALMNPLVDDRPRSFREMAGADWQLTAHEALAAAHSFDRDGDGRLNAEEWAEFAPLLNLTPDDHKHLFGPKGRGDINGLIDMLRIGDVDGSGTIDEREVLELGRRLNGNDPNTIQSFREAAGFDWQLDFNEFIATAESHDANKDGFNQEEWNRFAPILGFAPEDRNLFLDQSGEFNAQKFKAAFQLADTDGDGRLSAREALEMRRIAHEYFGPNDFPQF
ncbi:MAG: hypothetical protein JJU21_07870 [Salinarimonas sp.]|nr:hypothetical protein [Salinarimonas sp.]